MDGYKQRLIALELRWHNRRNVSDQSLTEEVWTSFGYGTIG